MKYLLAALMIAVLYAHAFSPMPTDPALAEMCESTGGYIIETYYKPDCGPLCDAMPETISDCMCLDGLAYMDIKRMADFAGCGGSTPECFSDGDCMRTNQGNACLLISGERGVCMHVQEPYYNGIENRFCTTFALALLVLMFGYIWSK